MSAAIDAVAVVVPAHDEELLLAECLDSVAASVAALRREHRRVRVGVWVVLDACADASDDIARAFPVATPVHVGFRNVGAARQAGVARALARFAGLPRERVWTAHTDADSAVPAHWLVHQLALAGQGADLVVGTVRPDFRDLDERRAAAWWRRYTPGVANGHVHGANLGVRASTLADAGGFAPIPEHEDVHLVDIARTQGAAVVASDGAWVRTSGRQRGRTPGGYARYLREGLV